MVLSGILMTLKMYNQATAVGFSRPLMAMQGLGILGALIILVHTLPTSTRLAQAGAASAPGAPIFEVLRRKVVMSGMIASTLGMLALVAAAWVVPDERIENCRCRFGRFKGSFPIPPPLEIHFGARQPSANRLPDSSRTNASTGHSPHRATRAVQTSAPNSMIA